MTNKLPLVVVLGATACGKSKLAIELARKFNGEIISADSMQVYHGLDIVTNKVTEEEQQKAKHHMINFLNPLHRYSVVDFKSKSLDIINNLLERKSLPIVVGGTNYYIESILWSSFLLGPTLDMTKRKSDEPQGCSIDNSTSSDTLMDAEIKLLQSTATDWRHTEDDLEDEVKFFKKRIYNEGLGHIDSERLWKILEKVDPAAAHYYHPNDKRRIIRCLQIIQEKNRNFSDILSDINVSGNSDKSSLGGPLRYNPTCILWLNCDNDLLTKILNERVDKMLARGLIAELENFHEDYNKSRISDGQKPNYDKGIFQTIGFKEFHSYLMLDSSVKESEEGNEILKKCIEEMKFSTSRYARRQLKWIRRRFLQSDVRDLPPVFKLEVSDDEELWAQQVEQPAYRIVQSLIDKTDFDEELLALKQEPVESSVLNVPGKLHCEVCDRILIGSHNIEQHLRSRPHQKKASELRNKKQRISEEDKKDDSVPEVN